MEEVKSKLKTYIVVEKYERVKEKWLGLKVMIADFQMQCSEKSEVAGEG